MIVLKPGEIYKSKKQRSAEILLCIGGKATLSDIGTDHSISLNKGVSIIVPATVAGYEIKGEAVFYKAAVPLKGQKVKTDSRPPIQTQITMPFKAHQF
jgi:hypothetical protein